MIDDGAERDIIGISGAENEKHIYTEAFIFTHEAIKLFYIIGIERTGYVSGGMCHNPGHAERHNFLKPYFNGGMTDSVKHGRIAGRITPFYRGSREADLVGGENFRIGNRYGSSYLHKTSGIINHNGIFFIKLASLR